MRFEFHIQPVVIRPKAYEPSKCKKQQHQAPGASKPKISEITPPKASTDSLSAPSTTAAAPNDTSGDFSQPSSNHIHQ